MGQHVYHPTLSQLFLFFTVLNHFYIIGTDVNDALTLAKCDVFNPFKVVPNDRGSLGSKSDGISVYQIGGPFPLHWEDCQKLRPETVQDVLAIQWALSLWNAGENRQERHKQQQRSDSSEEQPKLGLFAGDSCSRPKEAISQTLRFLDSVGYHEPAECQKQKQALPRENAQKLLAVLAPKDNESASSIASILKPSGVIAAAYTTESAQALFDSGLNRFISAAPMVDDFLELFGQLLNELNGSDLVAIVDNEQSSYTSFVTDWLSKNGVVVSDVVSSDHPLFLQIMEQTDARIILSLVSNKQMRELQKSNPSAERLAQMQKIWIYLDIGGTIAEGDVNSLDFLINGNISTSLQIITIRQRLQELNDFNAYFLRVLLGNYGNYALLTSYVEQMLNCTSMNNTSTERPKCSEKLVPKNLAQRHRQSAGVESLVKLVFGLGRAISEVNSLTGDLCTSPDSSKICFEEIFETLLRPAEQFLHQVPVGKNRSLIDPQFHSTNDGRAIKMSGFKLEAVALEREGRDGSVAYRLMELLTGPGNATNRVNKFTIPSKIRAHRSMCQRNRPFCGNCNENTRRMHADEVFLASPPKDHSIYITGLFDLHGAEGCDRRVASENVDSISLPLAFVYALTTFKDRFPTYARLFDLVNIGGILVDVCGKSKNLVEFLVDAERRCYNFSQAEQNWTIAPGASFGYISAKSGPELNHFYKMLLSDPSASPIVTLDGIRVHGEAPTSISFLPPYRIMAHALVKWLKRMRWDYVNVVIEKDDPNSMAIFKHFESESSNLLCIADLAFIWGLNEPHRLRRYRSSTNSETTSPPTSGDEIDKFVSFDGELPRPSANVTLVFGKASSVAAYMSARLRLDNEISGNGAQVHVVIGEAHDFYLYDPTNLAHYAGTISFQPKDISVPKFNDWLHSITPLIQPEPWFWTHVEEHWQCALSLNNVQRYQGRMCTGDELINVRALGRLTRAGYLMKGVDQMVLTILQAYRRLCTELSNNNENIYRSETICDKFLDSGRKVIRELLDKSSTTESTGPAFEIYEFKPLDHHGNFGYKLIANYTSATHQGTNGHFAFLEEYLPFSSGIPSDSIPTSQCRTSFCRCLNIESERMGHQSGRRDDTPMDTEEVETVNSYIRREPAAKRKEDLVLVFDDQEVNQLNPAEVYLSQSQFIKYIFLALTSIFTAIAVGILVLVCVKMYFRIVKGNQSLGIFLLFGVIAMYATAYVFITGPSDLICRTRFTLHALTHTICFAVVIVKAIQLKNAETLAIPYNVGLSGINPHQLSYWNYWLLLVFICFPQLVICLKWMLDSSFYIPFMSETAEYRLRCSYSSFNFFLAEAYNFILLLLSVVLTLMNRNIKRNYKEAKWLVSVSLVCTLIMILWATAHAFTSSIYMDYLTMLELYLTGTILLGFIFGPKLYVLLSYEPVIIECGMNIDGIMPEKTVNLFDAEWSAGQQSDTTSPFSARTTIRANGSPLMRPQSSQSYSSNESLDADSGIGPMFQTVLRKKATHKNEAIKPVQRSHSETDQKLKRTTSYEEPSKKQLKQKSLSDTKKFEKS